MIRSVKGYREMQKYKQGENLTIRQAGKAKCFECMGEFQDGKLDCKIEDCSLYPWMPYGSKPAPKRIRKRIPGFVPGRKLERTVGD